MTTSAALTFPCESCGAQLQYDASVRAMRCPYCGAQQAVQTQAPAGAVREIPIEEGLQRAARGLLAPVTTIACEDCGATVNVGQGERTARCAFCGSEKVLPREADPNLIRPESLVPFQVDKRGASDRFGAWLGTLWFRPSKLKKLASVEEMGGVYVPFWTFDALVVSRWTADAGYHYYETEYYEVTVDGRTETRSRQVQRTRWEPAWGQRRDGYDDVLVCASKGLPGDLVAKLSTFDTKRLLPYEPRFLAGWRAESYAIDLLPAWAEGQDRIASEQRTRCSRDVPGDTQRNLEVNNAFYDVTFKHVLLPVWIAAYRYDGKVYRFLVNGQTGEVVGKAPWSFWKIFLFVAAIVAAIALGAFLVTSRGGDSKPATPTAPALEQPQSVTPQPNQVPKPRPVRPSQPVPLQHR